MSTKQQYKQCKYRGSMTLFLTLLLVLWLPPAWAGEQQEHPCDTLTFGLFLVEVCPPYHVQSFPDERTFWQKLIATRYLTARISGTNLSTHSLVVTGGEVDMLLNGEGKRVTTSCERKLEAAMRAMEPWLLRAVVDPLDKNRRITNFVPFDATMERSESFHQWTAAMQQWDAAKACWQKERP